jgi:hypothetical protein
VRPGRRGALDAGSAAHRAQRCAHLVLQLAHVARWFRICDFKPWFSICIHSLTLYVY